MNRDEQNAFWIKLVQKIVESVRVFQVQMRVQIDFQANTEFVRFDCILSSGIRWLITIKMNSDASIFASYSRTALPASSKSMQF